MQEPTRTRTTPSAHCWTPCCASNPLPVSSVPFLSRPRTGALQLLATSLCAGCLSGLFRLPLTALEAVTDAVIPSVQATGQVQDGYLQGTPNSIDHLNQDDSFVQAATKLPISPEVRYHSIIARTNADADGPLADSDAGLVSYRSTHLPGAVSEKIIISGHSVQENVAAILEVRRILREDLAASTQASPH